MCRDPFVSCSVAIPYVVATLTVCDSVYLLCIVYSLCVCVIESLVVDEIKQAEGLSSLRSLLYRWLDAESDSHGACDSYACTESHLANNMCVESCDSFIV